MTLLEYLNSLPRGGKSKFAQRIKVPKSFLSNMATGRVKVPVKRAKEIEKETFGLVTKAELRPDIWE